MAFPDSKLSKFARRTIMVSVFVLFFITAPIIISYTAGYRYNFSSGKIERTGVISLDAIPTDATFYVNEKIVGQKSPLRVPNVVPGSYHISIRKSGYHSFEKDMTVQSQQTTYVKNIFLYRETLPEKFYMSDTNTQEMKVSPTGKFLLALIPLSNETDGKMELTLINTKDNTEQVLREIKSGDKTTFSWSPYADFIMIDSIDNGQHTLSILSAETPVSVRTETFSNNIEYFWGYQTNSPEIFIRDGEKIRVLTTIGFTDVATTTATAWLIDTNGQLWTANENRVLTRHDSSKPLAYSLPAKPHSIIAVDTKRAIVETDDGITIIKFNENEPEIHTISSAIATYFNIYTQEWLIWTDWELWSTYKDGTATILNRTGEKILSVRPLDKYGVLLIVTPKGIFAFNPGYYITQELTAASDIREAGANTENQQLYLLGKIGEKFDVYKLDY